MPQQNGIAEQLNRTLLEQAHAMLSAANQLKYLWLAVVHYMCIIKNCIPTMVIAVDKTPHKLF